MTVEEALNLNNAFAIYRKAMIRAAEDNRRVLATAGNSMFMLQRYHEDNLVDRWVGTPIAVSHDKDSLEEFCRKLYGQEIGFDDNDKSSVIEMKIGQAYFKIIEIALV